MGSLFVGNTGSKIHLPPDVSYISALRLYLFNPPPAARFQIIFNGCEEISECYCILLIDDVVRNLRSIYAIKEVDALFDVFYTFDTFTDISILLVIFLQVIGSISVHIIV